MGEIIHRTTSKGGGFYYVVDGKDLAEMVYLRAGEKSMIIEHTDVDDSLRGQGVGKKLLGRLVEYARENRIQVMPLCPFANATFKKMKEWQDVLSPVHIKPKSRN